MARLLIVVVIVISASTAYAQEPTATPDFVATATSSISETLLPPYIATAAAVAIDIQATIDASNTDIQGEFSSFAQDNTIDLSPIVPIVAFAKYVLDPTIAQQIFGPFSSLVVLSGLSVTLTIGWVALFYGLQTSQILLRSALWVLYQINNFLGDYGKIALLLIVLAGLLVATVVFVGQWVVDSIWGLGDTIWQSIKAIPSNVWDNILGGS